MLANTDFSVLAEIAHQIKAEDLAAARVLSGRLKTIAGKEIFESLITGARDPRADSVFRVANA